MVLQVNKMNQEELIIYNWLQNARFLNHKAKDAYSKNKKIKYSEKYDIILKAIQEINKIKSENIVYRWDRAGGSSCIHFYFGNQQSVSFHVPEIYAQVMKKEKLWNLK